MEELLLKHGYKLTEDPNVWTKLTWTIRYDDFMLEAYTDIKFDRSGKYYCGTLDRIDLKTLLTEIDDFLING